MINYDLGYSVCIITEEEDIDLTEIIDELVESPTDA